MRHVVVNRMPVAGLVPVPAPVPGVPQIPLRPTVPVYTYPSTYWPPVSQNVVQLVPPMSRPWAYQQPLKSAAQGQYVILPPAPPSITGDTEYLQYTDLIVDDLQYNQSQVLSVDNNYSMEYHQEYQQVQQVQCQYPQYANGCTYQVVEQQQPQQQLQQQLTYSTQADQMQQQPSRLVSLSVADPVQAAHPTLQPAFHQQLNHSQPGQLAIAPPPPARAANETIMEPIQIFIGNEVPPAASTPKEQEAVNLGLVVGDVMPVENVVNEVMINNVLDTSVDKDIRKITNSLNLDQDDSDVDLAGDTKMDKNDDDTNADTGGNLRLSDTDVVSLPIEYLKPEDLERRKKLLHHQHQSQYLENLVKKKGKEYVNFFYFVIYFALLSAT